MQLEQDKNKMKKGLYIVSTPIGNLRDITYRALDVLKNSDFIICEDTRVSKKLLNHYNIKVELIINHKFNERKNLHRIIDLIQSQKIVSLISDAGTPLISDPGKILVEECVKQKIDIIPIPGVSAITAALSICGFSNKFMFYGFFPDKTTQAEKEFFKLSNFENSIIFFVSARKINKYFTLLNKYFSGRKIVICREITKLYETFYRGELKDLKKFNINPKGEITLIISEIIDKKNGNFLSESDKTKIKKLMSKFSLKDVSEIMSSENKISKSVIYKYCLKLKNEN